MKAEKNAMKQKEIDILTEAFNDAYIENINPAVTRGQFYDLLKAASEDNIQNKQTAKLLSEYWLTHFSTSLIRTNDAERYLNDIDLFIRIITKNEVVADVVKEAKHSNMLACVCMVRTSLAGLYHSHAVKYNMEDMLTQWFDKPPQKSSLYSLEKMVDYLYGDAAWSMYREDVAWASQVPGYLWSLGLPLAAEKSVNQVSPTNLPIDIL